MKYLGFLILWVLAISTLAKAQSSGQSFLTTQMHYPRVRVAQQNQGKTVDNLLKVKNINKSTLRIKISAFKEEGVLEIWAKSDLQSTYILLQEFNICAKSGSLGTKLKQGDGQVPEGI